jgi:predicted dienelactone hydrolase
VGSGSDTLPANYLKLGVLAMRRNPAKQGALCGRTGRSLDRTPNIRHDGRLLMTSILRTFFVALFLMGLIACGDFTPTIEPPDVADAPDELGPFAVGHSSFEVVDAARDDRPLLVDAWYPVDAEDAVDSPLTEYILLDPLGIPSDVAVDDLPVSARADQSLIIFSHGYQSIHIQSFGLMEALASHGFIVISPEHTGNAQASPTDTFDEAASNRVPDVSFLIDMMFERNKDPEDAFYDRIAETSVGAVGHSFGAMTSIGMASGWAGASTDPRVGAIAPISAVIDGEMQLDDRPSPNAGFTQEQLESITIPVMLMGGTEDVNVPIGNNAIAFEQIINAPRVYKVDVIDANHNHFAAICPIGNRLIELGLGKESWPALGAEQLVEPYESTCGPEALPFEDASRVQDLYVVSFFRAHLLDESGYELFLTPSFAQLDGGAMVTAK